MNTCLTDIVTYQITYTLLDGPYAGESASQQIRRSRFSPLRVGDTLQMGESLFGNPGYYRVDSVKKVK